MKNSLNTFSINAHMRLITNAYIIIIHITPVIKFSVNIPHFCHNTMVQ